jgi:hypothetical protein
MEWIEKALALAAYEDQHGTEEPMQVALVYALAGVCEQLASIDDALRNTIGGTPR